jgi:hypothetical protein
MNEINVKEPNSCETKDSVVDNFKIFNKELEKSES